MQVLHALKAVVVGGGVIQAHCFNMSLQLSGHKFKQNRAMVMHNTHNDCLETDY